MVLPEGRRDELARIVEQIAQEGPEGLSGPRALDVALDAIVCTVWDEELGVARDSEFNYVIAYRHGENGEHLSCYMYGNTQVFFGSKADATAFLAYVRHKEPGKLWQIIPVGLR